MSLLKKDIFKFSKPAFGLDLSDLSVKAAQLKDSGSGVSVSGFGSAPISFGSIVDGEIINKENVVFAIKKALETSGPKKISSKKVVCSLPETKGFLRIISLPHMKEDEAKEAIKWEIEANIPLPLDQVYYDWQILDKNFFREEGRMSVLVVAFSKKTEDQFLEVLDSAGLEVVGMEIESVAQMRSLIDEKEEKKTVFIIDSGDRRTSFSIIWDGVPCFTSSIPLSGQTITDSIGKAFNLTMEEAEKKKLEFGIGSFVKKDLIFKAVEPVLENFVTEIERSVNFYLDIIHYSEKIDKVIICGGGSNTKGMVPFLSKRTGMEILVGNPWVNFSEKNYVPPIIKEKAGQFSTAIGLALKGLYI